MNHKTAARVACPVCKLLGPPISPASAAEQLASLHDEFQHRGQATAIVRRAETVVVVPDLWSTAAA
jgi:hypothetical protein